MPRQDGTGPAGKGSMTGRGAGPCNTGRGMDRGKGTGAGRGMGKGADRGTGRGMGRGRG